MLMLDQLIPAREALADAAAFGGDVDRDLIRIPLDSSNTIYNTISFEMNGEIFHSFFFSFNSFNIRKFHETGCASVLLLLSKFKVFLRQARHQE